MSNGCCLATLMSSETTENINHFTVIHNMPFMKETYFRILWLYLVLLLMSGVQGWRPYKIAIFDHKEQVYSSKCRVNASFTGNDVMFNMYVEYLTDFENLNMHTGIFFESYNGHYDMELINRTVDLCKFYKNKRYEPILQVIYKLVEQYLPQWFVHCPVKKGVYYLKNVELNVEMLPPFFPEKKGIFDASVWHKREKLYHVEVFFEIIKTFKKG